MVKDITIGQYFPGKSALHKMDPRMKIILLIVYIVIIFICKNFVSLSLMSISLVFMVALSRIPINVIMRGIKPIIIIIIFTAVLNIFYIKTGVLLQFWIIKIYTGGINTAIFISIRIICLIISSSLLTYTTSPTLITDGIERMFSPFKFMRNGVHTVAMMMTIALRFIPTLIEEFDKITNAQKARGADLESGGIIQRSKALIPIFIPLFVTSFRRAYELAFAMECRCYRGAEGRTRMTQMKFSAVDLIGFVLMTALCVGVVLINNRFIAVI